MMPTCRATRYICLKDLSSHASARLRPSERVTGVADIADRGDDVSGKRVSGGGEVAVLFDDWFNTLLNGFGVVWSWFSGTVVWRP